MGEANPNYLEVVWKNTSKKLTRMSHKSSKVVSEWSIYTAYTITEFSVFLELKLKLTILETHLRKGTTLWLILLTHLTSIPWPEFWNYTSVNWGNPYFPYSTLIISWNLHVSCNFLRHFHVKIRAQFGKKGPKIVNTILFRFGSKFSYGWTRFEQNTNYSSFL